MNPSANEGEGRRVRSCRPERSKAANQRGGVASNGFSANEKAAEPGTGSALLRRLSGTMVAAAVAVLLILGTGAAQPAQAQVGSVLHSFTGPTSDGESPAVGLIRDSSGNLYGTTTLGGSSTNCGGGCGTVFELVYDSSTSGYTEKVLYSFSGSDGAAPVASLMMDSAGNLYGTTTQGGSTYTSASSLGDGTVFELKKTASGYSSTDTVLFNFTGANGNRPTAGLTMDSAGNLYGTTQNGGTSGDGTVFELTQASGYKTENVLHNFTGYNSTTPASSDGEAPLGRLMMDSAGNLYGTTRLGGSSRVGTVFEEMYDSSTKSYTEKVLFSFTGSDGANPQAGLTVDPAGNLYGTTSTGGPGFNAGIPGSGDGTVFELTKASGYSSEQVLLDFSSTAVYEPMAGLTMDSAGNLYGAAYNGGGGTGDHGAVFELNPPATTGGSWTPKVLLNFNGANGIYPMAGLTMDPAGNLYGTTFAGGSTYVQGSSLADGTVFGIAPVTLSATSLSFGSVGVDTTSTAQTVTVTNTGTGQFSYSAASISGTNAKDFSVTNGCSAAVASNGACSVSVTFTPSTATTETASLNLTEAGLTQTISLTGTGAYATVGVAPGMGFPSQPVGSTSSPQTLTVTNTSSVMLNITSVGITGDFAIASNTCTSPVAAGKTCSVGVTFTPMATGKLTGKLTLNDNTSTGSQSVTLSGTGAITTVAVSPSTLSYPLQMVGTKSSDQMVTVMNSGGSTSLAFSSITAGSNFAVDASKSTCTTSTLVPPGGSCQVAVAFVPTTGGPLSGTLTLADDASPSTQAVALTGTGAAVSASPTSLTYGSTVVASTSTAQAVTVTNSGSTSISLTGITATGDFAVDATGTTCSTSTPMAGGSNCKVAVTFTPTAGGTRTGNLTIASSTAGSATVALTGTGMAPGVTLNPSSLTFSGTEVGNTSSAMSATLTNSGNSALTISGLKSGGDFAIDSTGTTCSAGLQLAASKSCTLAVTFTPTAGGTRTGAVTITDNASSSPQTLALSGAGEDFSMTARSNSETVSPGGAATFDLLLSSEGGFNQAVNLACSGAPKGAKCSVSPTSVTLIGTANASFGVKVTTTGSAMLAPGPGNFTPPPSGTLPLAAWLSLFGLLGLLGLAKLSPKGGRIRQLAPLATLALLIAFSVACGGGSSNLATTNSNATPAGTYTLTVTGTSGSLSQSTQVTLKVQ